MNYEVTGTVNRIVSPEWKVREWLQLLHDIAAGKYNAVSVEKLPAEVKQ